MYARTPSSGEGGDRPPAYPHFARYLPPPRLHRPPPHYCFDAARFACDASKPRYLDVERERLVTRWLAEANEALVRRERPPRYKPRSADRRSGPDSWSSSDTRRPNAPEWADNFHMNRRDGSMEPVRRDGSAEPEPNDDDSMALKDFVDRFSLPRVVRFESDERPVLLYRVLEAHRRVEAVQLSGKKGKLVGRPLYIPDSYDGWFSACGCRGGALATPRASLAALVRARAFALVSPRALPAYRARTPSGENGRGGAQYERAAARPGTPLRLAGVFADGSKAKAPKYAQLIDPQGNELFVPLNTKSELYEVCPDELSACERPEPTPQAPELLPSAVTGRAHRLPHLLSLCRLPARVKLLTGTVPIEMAHDIGDDLLLRSASTEPVLVMCTLPEYGSTPSSPTKLTPDPRHPTAKETLQLIPLNSPIKVKRTQLGYDSEKRMFLSTRLHKALTFCQLNVDHWIRQISYASGSTVSHKVKTAEDLIKTDDPNSAVKFEKERKFTLQGLKIDTSRLFGKSDKVLKDIPDENEGSIIFLSKNELEHMNYDVYSDDEGKESPKSDEIKADDTEQFTNEKMQVFREESGHPKRTKWFKHLKLLKSTDKATHDKIAAIEHAEKYREVRDPFDPLGAKHSSIERYQDMAKLIDDRFGGLRKNDGITENSHSYKSLTTSSSDMGVSQSGSNKKSVLTKSVSVQTGMPDSPYDKDVPINGMHGRKNLSVDHINYCGSVDSSGSSSRKLKSLDENMLKINAATKSSSHLEKRQRIQPDLIPEKSMMKSESFNQIQSCEEINMFGVGSMYNDSDFEINYKQHSYITEKLCSEFHVKTKKVLSKSTSNLLHPKKPGDSKKEGSNSNSMPTKTSEAEKFDKGNFRKKIDKPRAPTPNAEIEDVPIRVSEIESGSQVKLKRSISAIQKRKLPVIEDLPYGQVADAVDIEEEKIDSDSNSDNIYAEICNPTPSTTARSDEEDKYDLTADVLANDPIISIVKKEVISRNDERTKQMKENPFRHIEVVVIEKCSELSLDNTSVTSSEFDEVGGSKNDISIAIHSWERDEKSTSDQKNHAIRLEITSNMDEYPTEGRHHSLGRDIRLIKESQLSFGNSIHFNGNISDHSEAIYDTLK